MKFKLHGMVFSLLFALGLVFSFSIWGCGNGGDSQSTTAEDVALDPTNEQKVRDFLDHIVAFYKEGFENVGSDANSQHKALAIFGRQVRQPGPYHHGDVYIITINQQMRVVNHPKHPGLLGYGFNPDAGDSDVAGALKDLLDNSALEMTNCARYGGDNNDERVACATKIDSLLGQKTMVVGLHHAEDDGLFGPPDCPALGFELETSAEDVYNNGNPTEDDLKAYVKNVIGVTQKGMQDVTTEVILADLPAFLEILTRSAADPDFANPATQAVRVAFQRKLTVGFSERIACYGGGDFKHENIYIFIMSTDPDGTVLLNGNNSDLNGLNLLANDNKLLGDDKSIAGLFRNALTDGEDRDPVAGDSATVDYRWDDPLDPDDTNPNWFEDGLVPGTSQKTSYIEVANLFEDYIVSIPDVPSFNFGDAAPLLFIIGSGIYPEE